MKVRMDNGFNTIKQKIIFGQYQINLKMNEWNENKKTKKKTHTIQTGPIKIRILWIFNKKFMNLLVYFSWFRCLSDCCHDYTNCLT